VATLTSEELDRYARHLVLDGFGLRGQKRLKESSVLIIGAGGLGSPASLYLAAAGVGKLGLVDGDAVDVSNLQRQIAHSSADVGRPKVESAADKLRALNPFAEVVEHGQMAAADNILELVRGYDVVLDGTDTFAAKYLINDACVLAGLPYVHAGILRYQGQVLSYVPGKGPCLRCVFPTPPAPGDVPTCREAGVIGAMAGVVGSMQAMEAIKLLADVGEPLVGRMFVYDALKGDARTVKLPPAREDCAVCGSSPSITELRDIEQEACAWHI